jgi:hypothetical protein
MNNVQTSVFISICTKTSRAIHLEDQIRIFEKQKQRNVSELQEISNILEFFPDSYFSDQSDKIIFILNFGQDSLREKGKKIIV